MFPEGTGAVLGVSGGADSVCLLFVLHALQEELGIRLWAVHVNHRIRPEAGEDAAFVRQLCQGLGVPFVLKERDVPALAAARGLSGEEAAREARYECLREAAGELGGALIAVAHNAQDQAETVLFHLFRGTGLTGLCGMRPLRDGIARPLLETERGEILAYLERKGAAHVEDATNGEDFYARNRIRHHILPYAREQISEGCVAHMCRTAGMLAETEEYLVLQTRRARERCVGGADTSLPGPDREIHVDCRALLEEHPAIQKRLLLELLKELAPGSRELGAVHVESLLGLFTRQGNGDLNLPGGILARRRYREVVLLRPQTERPPRELPFAGIGPIPPGGWTGTLPDGRILRLELLEGEALPRDFLENWEKIPKSRYTKWLDCDKISVVPTKTPPLLTVRGRREGDFLYIRTGEGRVGRKSLKEYLIGEKVPRQERDGIPLLACGSHVLWAVGYRISEACKVGRDTRRILRVQLQEKTGGM